MPADWLTPNIQASPPAGSLPAKRPPSARRPSPFLAAATQQTKKAWPLGLDPPPWVRAKTSCCYAAAGNAPQLFFVHLAKFTQLDSMSCQTEQQSNFKKNFFRPEKKQGPQFPQFFFFSVARSRERTAIPLQKF